MSGRFGRPESEPLILMMKLPYLIRVSKYMNKFECQMNEFYFNLLKVSDFSCSSPGQCDIPYLL